MLKFQLIIILNEYETKENHQIIKWWFVELAGHFIPGSTLLSVTNYLQTVKMVKKPPRLTKRFDNGMSSSIRACASFGAVGDAGS
jgi:hypothetical protein